MRGADAKSCSTSGSYETATKRSCAKIALGAPLVSPKLRPAVIISILLKFYTASCYNTARIATSPMSAWVEEPLAIKACKEGISSFSSRSKRVRAAAAAGRGTTPSRAQHFQQECERERREQERERRE